MRVGIVGLGLIGGSLGAAWRRAGLEVAGSDISSRRQQQALDLELVDAVSPLRQLAPTVDVVVLAVPVLRIVEMLPTVDLLVPDDVPIVDTGSAKALIVQAMAALPGSARMVGGHPLAGSERSGPDAADAALFMGHPFILTPTERTTTSALDCVRELVAGTGSRPLIMDAADHDAVVAGTSHLPQILSSLLAATVPPHDALSGTGYQDMTRLARSDVALWRDVLLANAEEISRVGTEYRDRLDALLQALQTEDVEEIERLLSPRETEAVR